MEKIEQKLASFNDVQKQAVRAILHEWEGSRGEFVFPIVEGPPGTGKTTVGAVAAAKYTLEKRGAHVAYLAYTHFAADRALDAFRDLGLTPKQVLRIVDLGRKQRYQNDPYYLYFQTASDLTREERRNLETVPILITTLDSSQRVFALQSQPFIMIDEFSQISPPQFFTALHNANKNELNPAGYALLGDPNQLPVVTSQQLLRPNIGTFIMARKNYDPHQLSIQYRMHERICDAVNALREALNSYPIVPHHSVRERTLTTMGYGWQNRDMAPWLHDILNPDEPIVIVNTDELPGEEEVGFEGSQLYPAEAQLTAKIAEEIFHRYKDRDGKSLLPVILSPYNGQIGSIRGYLKTPSLDRQCTTIYQAQGREYPCVIISFTRKNTKNQIGFLSDPDLKAQTYVACSRGMAKLIILLSFSTFRGYRDFDMLLNKCRNIAPTADAQPSWVG